MTKWIPYPFFHDDVPVDISFVFEGEKPAGKHGFLKTEGRQFVFEDGTPVKFWGTNFNGWGCFPEKDYAEKLVALLNKSEEEMAEMREACLCRAMEFSKESVVEKWLQLFDETL